MDLNMLYILFQTQGDLAEKMAKKLALDKETLWMISCSMILLKDVLHIYSWKSKVLKTQCRLTLTCILDSFTVP